MSANPIVDAVQAQRTLMRQLEQAALGTLGPCPANLRESAINIHLPDGFISKTTLIRPVFATPAPAKCPLIIYYHGGAFNSCSPTMTLSPARAFASYFGAIVACPSYKLAPEHPFPAPVQSAWQVGAWLSNPSILNDILAQENVEFDPALGLVMAGTSAGANIAAVITAIAAARGNSRDLTRGLSSFEHAITGLFLSVPYLLNEEMVPLEYSKLFTSREDNANSPILTAEAVKGMEAAHSADYRSPWFSPLNLDLGRLSGEHAAKVYIQCGDLDTLRDDGIIYARVLKTHDVAETRMDVIKNAGHTGWVTLPVPQCHTDEIRQRSLVGMGWLLGRDWDETREFPY